MAVAAQKPEKPERNPLAFKKAEVTGILRKGSASGADATLFDQYFKQYFLPQFAKSSKDVVGVKDLPSLRNDMRIFFKTAKGPLYDQLATLTKAQMKDIAGKSDKHPAARVNALLILGEINTDAESGKPSPEVQKLLLAVVQSGRFPDGMVVASMVGLERHAAAGAIPAAAAAPLTKYLLTLLNTPDPPAGRTADAHDWMRRSAAQVLAAMGSPGPGNSVVTSFEKVIADPNTRPLLRCDIAECLGRLKYPANTKINTQALVSLLGHQAADTCQHELDAAMSEKRHASRGLLAYALDSSLHGLEGTDGRSGLLAVNPSGSEGRTLIDSIRTKLKSLHTAIENPDLADESVVTDVGPLIGELQSILPPKPEPKQPQEVVAPKAVAAQGNAQPAVRAGDVNASRAAARPASGGN